jgi:hypothetical protein
MVSGGARDSRRWTLLLPGPFCVRLSLVWKAEERRGATVSFRNGKAAAIEGALEGAWNSLISKRGEMAASEVVAYVRARCPGVDVPRIRFGIEQRLRQRGARW